jgi:hypothetical protein
MWNPLALIIFEFQVQLGGNITITPKPGKVDDYQIRLNILISDYLPREGYVW